MFFDKTGPVQETFHRLRENLEREEIDYVIIGAFALGAHNFERVTMDVDICIRKGDLERFRTRFVGQEYQSVKGLSRRFYDPKTQITFDLLVSGELAGHTGKNKEIRFPDPAEAQDVRGLRTISLERLIALKLVTWRFKDWGDVVELIRRNNLDEAYSDRLPESVRAAYLQCHDQMADEERYEREHGGH